MTDQQPSRMVSKDARDRIAGEDPVNIVVEPPSPATNEAAVKILREQGVDAYEQYLRDHHTNQ